VYKNSMQCRISNGSCVQELDALGVYVYVYVYVYVRMCLRKCVREREGRERVCPRIRCNA